MIAQLEYIEMPTVPLASAQDSGHSMGAIEKLTENTSTTISTAVEGLVYRIVERGAHVE